MYSGAGAWLWTSGRCNGDYVTRRAPFYVYDCLVPWEKRQNAGCRQKKQLFTCVLLHNRESWGAVKEVLRSTIREKRKKYGSTFMYMMLKFQKGNLKSATGFLWKRFADYTEKKISGLILRKYAKANETDTIRPHFIWNWTGHVWRMKKKKNLILSI